MSTRPGPDVGVSAPPNGKGTRKAARAAARAAKKRGEMTLVEHLTELRRRLVISVAAVTVGAVVGWFLYRPVLRLLLDPYRRAVGDPHAKFVFFGVAEPFLIQLKVSVVIGLFIASPVVLMQLWRFITPGLYPNERRMAIPFILSSIFLFCLGAFFAWLTFPAALKFLLGFGGAELAPFLSAERYITFMLLLILAFGVSFELPVVLQFLVLAGVVSSRQLRTWRRWAILLITIFAAVITPTQDPFSMTLMAAPMVVFYEAVIWISRLVFKK